MTEPETLVAEAETETATLEENSVYARLTESDKTRLCNATTNYLSKISATTDLSGDELLKFAQKLIDDCFAANCS